ncbi:hypothetical protein H0A36_10500 [Endozoicomonas sp. SM1973]|uniref:Uncharacterized protein n=1 Tax=Spartinivicinus marinus TaxID=2994442 RepID=A0A853I1E0_9GAMM|nr:hypothetical protein [Spartinivicinus marinus]MCX4027385.1 hypothetical protein [Spartinivicinus marinus]NYZ66439.1 hypothetical protein [Spartinivicinus marinus]
MNSTKLERVAGPGNKETFFIGSYQVLPPKRLKTPVMIASKNTKKVVAAIAKGEEREFLLTEDELNGFAPQEEIKTPSYLILLRLDKPKTSGFFE